MPVAIQEIHRIASALNRVASEPEVARELSLNVAEALRWTSRAGLSPVQKEIGHMQVTRGFIGPQPAAVFSVGMNGNSNLDLLNSAALYAYHASIQWGLVATKWLIR